MYRMPSFVSDLKIPNINLIKLQYTLSEDSAQVKLNPLSGQLIQEHMLYISSG